METNRLRRTTPHAAPLLGAAALALLTLSACAPAPTADWAGQEPLSAKSVEVAQYEAAPGLPDLTAPRAARAAGFTNPTTNTATHARGDGWSASVTQGEFGTRIVLGRECGTPEKDAAKVTAAASDLYEGFGGDAGEQAWFTVTEQGADRAFAEPLLDGTQTWSTGFLAARVDGGGVCTLSGTVMGFRETGKPTTFISAEEAFAVVDGGRFDTVEQTYTLGTAGRLVPVWRFSGGEGAAVVVDLGDGLESAPDTETYLRATPPQ